MSYEFKVGDKVKAWGHNGVVQATKNSKEYPVRVVFNTGDTTTFTADGRHFSWHKTPSLKLRKFKKKPVPSEIWVNI